MKHCILFTGHMIDEKDRVLPRFPAGKELLVRDEIKKCLMAVKPEKNAVLCGIAGGACGGDILFHELCGELGIASEMYLALPPEEYKKRSVAFAGMSWVHRFDRLADSLPVYVMPGEMDEDSHDNIWARCNQWMMDHAMKKGGEHMTIIALWDGRGGDGAGGTEHMVDTAREKGAKTEIINILLL